MPTTTCPPLCASEHDLGEPDHVFDPLAVAVVDQPAGAEMVLLGGRFRPCSDACLVELDVPGGHCLVALADLKAVVARLEAAA